MRDLRKSRMTIWMRIRQKRFGEHVFVQVDGRRSERHPQYTLTVCVSVHAGLDFPLPVL